MTYQLCAPWAATPLSNFLNDLEDQLFFSFPSFLNNAKTFFDNLKINSFYFFM